MLYSAQIVSDGSKGGPVQQVFVSARQNLYNRYRELLRALTGTHSAEHASADTICKTNNRSLLHSFK